MSQAAWVSTLAVAVYDLVPIWERTVTMMVGGDETCAAAASRRPDRAVLAGRLSALLGT